ncbi:MAG: hypothetical protein AAF626_01245 [Pseudomonadota bacterium]
MNALSLRLIFGLLIAIPFIGINLYAIGAWESFSSFEREFNEDGNDSGPPEPLASVGKGFFDFVKDRRAKSATHALFDVNTPNRARRIEIIRTVTIDAALADGEAAPEPALHELYLAARGPDMIMAECPNVLKVLARVCAVADFDVDPRDDGEFRLRLNVGFLQVEPAGDLSLIDESTVETRRYTISAYEDALVKESDLEIVRRNAYATAQDACNKLRDLVGSCVVNEVHIKEELVTAATPTREAGYRAFIRFHLSYLKNEKSELLAASAPIDSVAAVGDVVDTAPPPTTSLPKPDDEAVGALAGLLEQITGGDQNVDVPSADEAPRILNGGGVFGTGANSGKTLRVQN